MAENYADTPRNHGVVSSTGTTMGSTVRKAVKWGVVGAFVPALAIGGVAAVAGMAIFGALTGLWVPAIVFGMFAGMAGFVGGGIVTTGAAGTVAAYGGGIGGVVGLLKGLTRVGREQAAFDNFQINAQNAYVQGQQDAAIAIQQQLMAASQQPSQSVYQPPMHAPAQEAVQGAQQAPEQDVAQAPKQDVSHVDRMGGPKAEAASHAETVGGPKADVAFAEREAARKQAGKVTAPALGA